MSEEKITFGPGTIYIDGNEFAGISDFSVEQEEFDEAANQAIRFNINESSVLSGTISLNMWQLYNAIGYIQWLKDNCPNKRVIHLIKHGKNKRVRWKNFIRAGRIVERRLKRCSHS